MLLRFVRDIFIKSFVKSLEPNKRYNNFYMILFSLRCFSLDQKLLLFITAINKDVSFKDQKILEDQAVSLTPEEELTMEAPEILIR